MLQTLALPSAVIRVSEVLSAHTRTSYAWRHISRCPPSPRRTPGPPPPHTLASWRTSSLWLELVKIGAHWCVEAGVVGPARAWRGAFRSHTCTLPVSAHVAMMPGCSRPCFHASARARTPACMHAHACMCVCVCVRVCVCSLHAVARRGSWQQGRLGVGKTCCGITRRRLTAP